MLNKKNRISNRQLIEKLFKKGKLYKNNYFLFRFLPSIESTSKFAVIVSKKVAPKAVDRNYLRRQINEAIKNNIPLLKIDIISLIIVKTTVKKASYEELNKGIMDFFNQNKLHEQ
jgi:ribonuclease P protein component